MKQVPITPEIIDAIEAALKRKGKTMRALLKGRADIPPGFTYRTVTAWTARAQKTTRSDHLSYVLNLLSVSFAPSSSPADRVTLDSKTIAAIKAERKRTGLTPANLLRGATARPKDLPAKTITNWLSGKVKSARTDHLDYVLELWHAQPDAAQRQIPLEGEALQRLYDHRKRTGRSATSLLAGLNSRPRGLTNATVTSWFNGKAETTERHLYDFVIDLYERQPDWTSIYVQTDDPLLGEIRSERRRTGISAARLLNGRSDVPDGLTPQIVDKWLSKRVRSARKDHARYVLKLWRAKPDKGTQRNEPPAKQPYRPWIADYIEITPELREQLCRYRDRSGMGPSELLAMASDPPEGLNNQKISAWLTGKIKKAEAHLIYYVLYAWASQPSKN